MLKDISVLVVLSLLFTLVLKKIWSESKYCSFNSSTPTDQNVEFMWIMIEDYSLMMQAVHKYV